MQYLQQNLPTLMVVLVLIILIIDLAKAYFISKHDKEANHRRNIWDYSLLPGLSRALHNTPWQYSLLSSFLLIFLVVYLITGNEVFLRLLEANFALLVGSMLKIDWSEKTGQKKENKNLSPSSAESSNSAKVD